MKYLSHLAHLSPLLLQLRKVLVTFYTVNKWHLPKPHLIGTEDGSRAEERKLFEDSHVRRKSLLNLLKELEQKSPGSVPNFLNLHGLVGA
jgi:hypothetical protein